MSGGEVHDGHTDDRWADLPERLRDLITVRAGFLKVQDAWLLTDAADAMSALAADRDAAVARADAAETEQRGLCAEVDALRAALRQACDDAFADGEGAARGYEDQFVGRAALGNP